MVPQTTYTVWEFLLFWTFTGSSMLGLPPGERDAALVKAVPPQTLAYYEWVAPSKGQPGTAGIDGFAADPEVQQFLQMLDAALERHGLAEPPAPVPAEVLNNADDGTESLRSEVPRLAKLIALHPGCLFLGYEPQQQNKPGIANWLNLLTGIHGGVVLSSGDDTDKVWRSLNHLLKSMPDFQMDGDSPTQSIPLKVPGYQLVMHREANRIIFALGQGTLERILQGLSGEVPGLDSNPRFRAAIERVAVPRMSTVGWVDGRGILGSTMTAMGPLGALMRPLLTLIAADAVDHVVTMSGVENATMTQRTFVATGGRTDGLMVLAAGRPIQPQQFAHIPADADLVMAASINLANLFREARQVLARTQPLSVRVFDQAVKQLEAELELKIVDDVLPAFGDVVTAFDAPTNGGIIATSLVVGIEVRDPQKAEVVFTRLMKLLEQSLVPPQGQSPPGETSSLHRQPFLGHTIHYVQTTGPEANSPLTPSFCLTSQHLLFAPHPQALKAQLRFLSSKQPGYVPVANPNGANLAGETLAFAYLNGPRANSTMASLLPFLSHGLLNHLELQGISLDPFAIPSAAAIAPYFGDASATITRQKDGLMVESRNAPPVIVSLALLSAYKAWQTADAEWIADARRKASGAGEAELGQAGNEVVPALAEQNPPPPPLGPAPPSPYRKMGALLLRSLIPPEAQGVIPEETLKQLEEGLSAATLQRREEARRKREERRRRRVEPLR